jgi:hypothetical protein
LDLPANLWRTEASLRNAVFKKCVFKIMQLAS